MKIELDLQTALGALPLMPVRTYTGSALPLEIFGIPNNWCGGKVAAVAVTVTNANGVAVTGSAVRDGNAWKVLFAAANFANYGYVAKGVRIVAAVERTGKPNAEVIVGVADLDLVAAAASASPGTPSAFYVVKGDRCFVRSQVVAGVQHFVEQTMEFDAQIGWGANWSGDYILDANGDFISFTTGA